MIQTAISSNQSTLLIGIFSLIALWLMAGQINTGNPVVNHIEPDQAALLIESGEALVIDVRENDAFEKGHLPNAISVPIGQLEDRLDELHASKASDVIVYCNEGSSRGPRATKMMNDAGYSKAVNLKGGAEGWVKSNLNLMAR